MSVRVLLTSDWRMKQDRKSKGDQVQVEVGQTWRKASQRVRAMQVSAAQSSGWIGARLHHQEVRQKCLAGYRFQPDCPYFRPNLPA